jgi:hypothetical protein
VRAYATLRDANWKAKALQLEDDSAPGKSDVWREKYSNGCARFSSEDQEGGRKMTQVVKMEVKKPGSAHDPVLAKDDVADGNEEDEKDSGDDGASADEHADIKQMQQEAWRQGRKGRNCRGSGCGGHLCDNYYPQTEEDWICFSG